MLIKIIMVVLRQCQLVGCPWAFWLARE